jgi:hypothetical protein
MCDSCMASIKCWQSRVACTVCYNYDLCLKCFQAGKESQGHKSTHKVSHIIKTHKIESDDLVPVRETVNPELNAEGTRANWSVQDMQRSNGVIRSTRLVHLHETNSHARFLANAKPGHYAVSVFLSVVVASQISAVSKARVQKTGAGWLRVSLGTVKNKRDFFGTRFDPEDRFSSNALAKNSLPHKLLNQYWWDVHQVDLDVPMVHVQSDAVINIEGEGSSLTEVGFILQWSGTPAFKTLKESVISLVVEHIQ